MSASHIRDDLQQLAGRLVHRGASTEDERIAAEYIHDRLKQYAADTEIDDFFCMDSPQSLFASYYAEFSVVSLIAIWWPRIALCYGSGVFLAYLAEFMGHTVMGRFTPQFETQNVVARWLSPRPKRLFVVTAHYDSRRSGPLAQLWGWDWTRPAHIAVIICMLLVIGTCAVHAINRGVDHTLREETFLTWLAGIRWASAVSLLCAAAALAIDARASDYQRGANDNASGVSALLALAERIEANPIPTADVYLVATGGNSAWMSGARQLVDTHGFDQETTRFLNIDEVGAGKLRYATSEGVLHAFPAGPELRAAADAVAAPFEARPTRLATACSDALIPHARGYQAMTITAIPEKRAKNPHDTLVDVDPDVIVKATDFAEAILRHMAKQSALAEP